MNCKILTPAAVLATLALAVTPAFAQHSGGGHSRSGGSSGSSRGSSGGSSAGTRSSAPSRTYSAAPSRTYGTAPSRTYGSATSRTYGTAASRGVYAQSRGAAVPHGAVSHGYGSSVYGSHGVYAAPYHLYHPYYSFHSHFSVGFGLYVGYPIAYPYAFYYGYPYGYPYAYPYAPYYDPGYAPYPPPSYSYPVPNPSSAYPPANYPPENYPQSNGSGQSGYYEPDHAGTSGTSVTAQPGTPSGGVSFEITPATAEVLIDGHLAGHVSDLGPTTQPLALTPGRHHIEIRAAGYQTMVVDADIVAGQVIPYQGQMQAAR